MSSTRTDTVYDAWITGSLTPMAAFPVDIEPHWTALPDIRSVLLDIYGTLLISGSGDVGTARDKGNDYPVDSVFEAAELPLHFPDAGSRVSELLERFVAEDHARKRKSGVDYPEVDIRDIWRQVLEKLSDDGIVDGPVEDETIDRIALSHELLVNPVWLMPGFPGITDSLKNAGLLLGIVSNAQFYTPPTLTALTGRSLEDLGFRTDLCAWSWRLGRAKPSVEIFSGPLARLSAEGIAPEQVLYVGNDMLNDVTAAAAAGCRTALFAGDRRSYRPRGDDKRCAGVEPDIVVTSLDQLDRLKEDIHVR